MTPKMPRGAIPTPEANSPLRSPIGPRPVRKSLFQAGFPTPNQELATAQPYRSGRSCVRKLPRLADRNWLLGERQGEQFELGRGSLCQGLCRTQGVHPDRLGPVHFARMRFVEFRRVHANARVSNGPQGLFGWAVQFGRLDERGDFEWRHRQCRPGEDRRRLSESCLRPSGQVTPGTSGWAIYGLPTGQPEDHCASLCGYGSLAALVDLFERRRGQCQCPFGHAYGTLLRDVHAGLHRYRRPAIADEHHGRSLGSNSDDDRQESQPLKMTPASAAERGLVRRGAIGQMLS